MQWMVHGERSVYASPWVSLSLVDVEVPGGERFDHHVVRVPNEAVGTIVTDVRKGVLLLWRHRFITDTWGWEIPAGGVDAGESLEAAAAREVLEETGWRVDIVRHQITFHPSNGLSDQRFHIFVAANADLVADPTDPGESERIEWVPVPEVRSLAADGRITDGLSLTGLSHWLAFSQSA